MGRVYLEGFQHVVGAAGKKDDGTVLVQPPELLDYLHPIFVFQVDVHKDEVIGPWHTVLRERKTSGKNVHLEGRQTVVLAIPVHLPTEELRILRAIFTYRDLDTHFRTAPLILLLYFYLSIAPRRLSTCRRGEKAFFYPRRLFVTGTGPFVTKCAASISIMIKSQNTRQIRKTSMDSLGDSFAMGRPHAKACSDHRKESLMRYDDPGGGHAPRGAYRAGR